MATYLTNKETQAAVENIIMNAEKTLILVSPYVALSSTLLARIKAAGEKGVRIKVMYRIDKVKKEELERLKGIKNVELKYTNDLHAKCYFNEKEMIITSLNLLETSEKNWEMGIRICRTKDKEIFDKAMRDVQTIFMDSATLSKTTVQAKAKDNKTKSSGGYCIRCGENIRFNINKPLCPNCFLSWDEWGNIDYPENFCHFSGEESEGETCFAFPIVNKNWKKAKEIYKL
jgi:hypothetical protein